MVHQFRYSGRQPGVLGLRWPDSHGHRRRRCRCDHCVSRGNTLLVALRHGDAWPSGSHGWSRSFGLAHGAQIIDSFKLARSERASSWRAKRSKCFRHRPFLDSVVFAFDTTLITGDTLFNGTWATALPAISRGSISPSRGFSPPRRIQGLRWARLCGRVRGLGEGDRTG